MNVDIDSIIRKLLIKYPSFGSIIANLEFKESKRFKTAATDGKIVYYNKDYVNSLNDKEKIALFLHEICHVAFDHISRRDGKDKDLWNIATDAVINAMIKNDGLPIIKGGIDIPEAINYDSEEMYEILLKEKEQQMLNQMDDDSKDKDQNQTGDGLNGSNGGQGSSNDKNENDDKQNDDDSNSSGNNQKDKNSLSDGKDNSDESNDDANNDSQSNEGKEDEHSLWDEANREKNEGKSEENKKETEKKDDDRLSEKDAFEKNREERERRLQELNEELMKDAAQDYGDGVSNENRKLEDIGIAAPLLDWKRLLKEQVKRNEEWTRRNARARYGFFRHRIQETISSETEIVVDVSGSVSQTLLKNFLKECKNIIKESKVKVGFFNNRFHGFHDIKKVQDIDDLRIPIGGGTNFDVAVNAFSKKATNKIIFTDGEAPMPKKDVPNVTWIVFGKKKINPKGGRVIYIDNESLRRLYSSRYIVDEEKEI